MYCEDGGVHQCIVETEQVRQGTVETEEVRQGTVKTEGCTSVL